MGLHTHCSLGIVSRLIKMHSLAAVLCIVTATFLKGIAADTSQDSEVVTIEYERNDRSSVPMDIHVDRDASTVTYHMKDKEGFFADVDTFEDYETGYAASRVASQDACFLRQLTESLDMTLQRLHNFEAQGVQHILGNTDVWAEPLDDLEGVAGPRLASFCGDVPVYKLVRPDDSIERKPHHQKDALTESLADYLKESSQKSLESRRNKRQTTVTFIKCFLFFFFPICWRTNITVNTGTTFTFFFFG